MVSSQMQKSISHTPTYNRIATGFVTRSSAITTPSLGKKIIETSP